MNFNDVKEKAQTVIDIYEMLTKEAGLNDRQIAELGTDLHDIALMNWTIERGIEDAKKQNR